MSDAVLEGVLRRDRYVVAAALVALTLLSWAYVLRLAADMDMTGTNTGLVDMSAMMTLAGRPWGPADFWFMLLMWIIMMIGMMLPSAAPVVLLYARVGRQAASSGRPFAATGWFAAGYLLAWAGYSVAATFAQWMLERLALLTPMMTATSGVFSGIVLIAIGAYQWTALKYACLSQCQAPLTFIQRHGGFRPDALGSLRLGVRHGAYCVVCCWALMALLFVGGVMNVLWIAGIAVLVLLEKVIPAGHLIPRLAGVAFIIAGVWLLANALVGPPVLRPA
jgi:predicted metal-binding membrane protein